MSFWDWFIRPFAEIAAALVIAFGVAIVMLLIMGLIHIFRK